MKEINSIPKVLSLFSQKDGIAYKTIDYLFINNRTILLKEDEFVNEQNFIIYKTNKSIGNGILYVFVNGCFVVYDRNGFINGHFFWDVNNYVALKIDKSKYSSSYFVKADNHESIFEVNGINSISYFNTKKIILKNLNKKEIISYDINGNFMWHFSTNDGFKIFGKVQVVENIIFFLIEHKDENSFKTIGIDINTGKQIWELNNTVYLQINPADRLLYGYSSWTYQVVNPRTGKIVTNKNMDEYYKKNIDPFSVNNTIADNRLWFVSGRGENSKFGALNIETSEIEFVQNYPLDNDGQFSAPIFHNNKLYIRDSGNVLHIFE